MLEAARVYALQLGFRKAASGLKVYKETIWSTLGFHQESFADLGLGVQKIVFFVSMQVIVIFFSVITCKYLVYRELMYCCFIIFSWTDVLSC